MNIKALIFLVFVMLPLAAFGQLRATDLTNPAPINIPSGVSQAAAKDAVVQAMFARGWTVAEENDDRVVADLHVRSHWAQVEIVISDEDIRISYVDSENLRYTERADGRVVIHGNYLTWVDNLVADIRTHLSRAQRDARG